ncbi:hypothetical protein CWR40_004216 [Cronobacter sakazakii]|uniref:Uncharacterized protein n=2 Tax=Cronobacter sakazakii TaxID=28141 RepID=A0A853HD61_CROSK|nr:hypothetical protein [Cronobacter sakazakii]AKE94567.1 hypothetical protein CSK29544_01608 [Cronobacter sakazakii]AXW99125.2 hypothetical protein CsakCS931_34490 [Cronobacter sakazakii]EIZ2434143.1 hypothetical protein [Cronobacter sakazakii]EIZ2456309.1 hypothetical protein [Cronobacter sakazakii]EIZ9236094.1 hypothetical protein [Cronobacter sakazakii]
MKKSRKILVYVIAAIIALLIIPEIILREVPNDMLASLGDFTSLGGLISPFLSAMIFIGVSSILIGILSVYAVRQFYRFLVRVKSK